MNKYSKGFTAIEGLLVIIVVAVIGLAGFFVANHKQKSSRIVSSTSLGPGAPTASEGSSARTDAVDSSDASSEASSEAADDNSYANNDQSAATSSNAAAANIGGSYDESSF